MFRFVALLATLLSVAAFAPVARVQRSALKMSFESEIGAQPPLGFWDPLGLSNGASQEKFDNLRFAELKHGRVAMLAVVGHLVQNVVRLPGSIDIAGDKFADFPNGIAAVGAIPFLGTLQIILSIGWWDLKVWKQVPGSTPGDFGIPYLKQYQTDAQRDEIRAKELNNGRAAMMGILSIFVHEGFGRPYVINDLLGLDYNWNN